MPTFPTHKAYRNITIEQNQTNFPSVAGCWLADDATDTSVVDSFGSGTFTGITNLAFGTNANGSRYMYASSSITNQGTATLPTIGTSPFILFAVLKTTGGSIALGSTTGIRTTLAAAPITHDGTTTITGGTATVPSVAGGRANIISAYNAVGGQQTWATDNGSNEYFPAAVNTTTLASIDYNPDNFTLVTQCTELYGFVLFKFASIPADYRRALSWMTAEWIKGNKVIYPGWKGLS